jgi:hypothetical protein
MLPTVVSVTVVSRQNANYICIIVYVGGGGWWFRFASHMYVAIATALDDGLSIEKVLQLSVSST